MTPFSANSLGFRFRPLCPVTAVIKQGALPLVALALVASGCSFLLSTAPPYSTGSAVISDIQGTADALGEQRWRFESGEFISVEKGGRATFVSDGGWTLSLEEVGGTRAKGHLLIRGPEGDLDHRWWASGVEGSGCLFDVDNGGGAASVTGHVSCSALEASPGNGIVGLDLDWNAET